MQNVSTIFILIEGVNLLKVHCTHLWNYHNEAPLYYDYVNNNIKVGW
jgi:hypothetical protein